MGTTRTAVMLEQTRSRFFARLGEHRIAADKATFDRFTSYLKEVGLGRYLPQ